MKCGIFGLVCVIGLAAMADVKADIRKVTAETRKYSNGTYRDEVHAKAVSGLKAYNDYSGSVGCTNELDELAVAVIRAARASNDFALAMPLAERYLAADGKAASIRLAAAGYKAIACIEKGDFAAAEACYDGVLARGKLSADQWAEAWAGKAEVKTLQNDYSGAVATLQKAFRAVPAERARPEYERFLQERLAAVHCAFHRPQTAFDYYLSLGRRMDALSLYDRGLLGDMEQASSLCRRMMTDEKATFNERLAGWTWLCNRDGAFAETHFPLRADDNRSRTNAVVRALARKLSCAQIYSLEGSTSPIAYFGNRTEVIRTWKTYRWLLAATGERPEFLPAQSAVMSYLAAGEKAEALAIVAEALEGVKMSDEERYEFALMRAVLPLAGSVGEIAAAVARIEPSLAGALDAKKRLKRFDRVGSAALMLTDDNLARGIVRYREKVCAEPPKKSYAVRFSDRPVAGAADWANLPFKPEQSAFDRKYGGGGAAFLVTDVSTGDRGEAVKGGEGRATLEVVADAWGLHILRTFHDRRARDFERGFLDAGSFEEYLAPGENQPYTCFIVYPKKGMRAGGFRTAYDGEGRRRMNFKDPALFRSDVHFTDDAIKVYTGISWDNFPTLVPVDGAAWEFESVFWGPNECAWNGLKTIHGRSSWGRLVFEMPESARLKILEDQICKAVVRYKAEKKDTYGQEGLITHWQDAEIGDPVFYASRMKPLVDELDAVVGRVNAEMTAADVKDIAENWLQKLVDFRFVVDRMRTDYLREHL